MEEMTLTTNDGGGDISNKKTLVSSVRLRQADAEFHQHEEERGVVELEGGGYGVGEVRRTHLVRSRDRTKRDRNTDPTTHPEEIDEEGDDDGEN